MIDKSNTIKLKNDKNEEIECKVKFTFDSDETNKSYIVYTDGTMTQDAKEVLYAAVYDKTGQSDELKKVETEKEWDLIYSVAESLPKEEEENE